MLTADSHSAVRTPSSALPPPLKWAGGKRWLLPRLHTLWDRAHGGQWDGGQWDSASARERRLVEPFVGGLAVALGLRPARALLNDSNPHLITFYRQLQRGLVSLVAQRNE